MALDRRRSGATAGKPKKQTGERKTMGDSAEMRAKTATGGKGLSKRAGAKKR